MPDLPFLTSGPSPGIVSEIHFKTVRFGTECQLIGLYSPIPRPLESKRLEVKKRKGKEEVSKRCENEPPCEEEAVVGWGSPPVWVCMRHFEERLASASHVIEVAKVALTKQFGEGKGA